MPEEQPATPHDVLESKATPEEGHSSEKPSLADQTHDAVVFVSCGNFEGLTTERFADLAPKHLAELRASAYRARLLALGENSRWTKDPHILAKVNKLHSSYQQGLEESLAQAVDGIDVTEEEVAKMQRQLTTQDEQNQTGSGPYM